MGLLQPDPPQSKLPEPTPLAANGFAEESVPLGQSQHDLSQSAFLSWLSQTQQATSLLNSSVLTPDSSTGKEDCVSPEELPDSAAEDESTTETQIAWYNLLPRAPCSDSLLTTSVDKPSSKAATQLCKPSSGAQPKASAWQVNTRDLSFLRNASYI